jgi:hypothetical protein
MPLSRDCPFQKGDGRGLLLAGLVLLAQAPASCGEFDGMLYLNASADFVDSKPNPTGYSYTVPDIAADAEFKSTHDAYFENVDSVSHTFSIS